VNDIKIIDDFKYGIDKNSLGGITLVFHENGVSHSLQSEFVKRKGTTVLSLNYDFSDKNPPSFVGYATRLQFEDWSKLVENYSLCFKIFSKGVKCIFIEIKRLENRINENSCEEILKKRLDLGSPDMWEKISLPLLEFGFKDKKWDNLWQICFVLNPSCVYNDKGFIQIDRIELLKIQDSDYDKETTENITKQTVITDSTFNNSPVNTGSVGTQNISYYGSTTIKENKSDFSNNQGQINVSSDNSKINAKVVKND
jgi:hypothetical protein